MPDREQFIAQWRRGLAEAMDCDSAVLDELESHLRDEIQQLLQAGHTEEQALSLASTRLGTPSALAHEFAKVAAPWLPARLIVFLAIVLAVLLTGYLLIRCRDGLLGFLLAAHVDAVTLGYTGSLLVGFLAVCYVLRRPFRDLSAGQMRTLQRTAFLLAATAAGLTFTGTLLGCVWAKDHLGRYWGWAPQEIGGVCVLVWQIAMLLLWWRGSTRGRLALRLSILGNIVVSHAWFIDALFPSHSYGQPPIVRVVLVFGLLHALMFGLSFLPARRSTRTA